MNKQIKKISFYICFSLKLVINVCANQQKYFFAKCDGNCTRKLLLCFIIPSPAFHLCQFAIYAVQRFNKFCDTLKLKKQKLNHVLISFDFIPPLIFDSLFLFFYFFFWQFCLQDYNLQNFVLYLPDEELCLENIILSTYC